MYRQLYYENYLDYYRKESDEYLHEEKVLPYMVLIHDKKLRECFKNELLALGFKCCTWNDSYPGVLVNIKFNRFGLIHRPCNFAHFDDRTYSYEEFYSEILKKKYGMNL